ncbi:MAG: 2-dehydro-3-deoxy-D-gluconate 5-dehydrogenase [Alphaproteobacteria bacterium MarineAlpha9_Bin2]|nr:MAG: 2-dehydro-3-deoxy-D-gluconate 5-dehydrogenase [Alphaproteobacteria bacterium MarineAlpha9_Bin1]PPR31088.1 MAG: 2-dehydro-3-deoxy-D-gluconate 5-dehydrogenase [Alphaproteobacteria bacterium MarineAlpha9_Bin2]
MAYTIDLSGKVALITGGASGIGYSIALSYLEAGAEVIVTAKTDESVKNCVTNTEYGSLKIFKLDVTNDISIEKLFSEIDKLDILVNNAGIVKRGLEYRVETFAEVINTNLMGIMRMSHEALPKLALSHGNIINIASVWSFFGSPISPGYTASKTGVVGLTRSLANGWAEHKVRVNCIAPGWIETKLNKELRSDKEQYDKIKDRTPMKRWGNPKEIAGAAVYLASEKASFTTGTTIIVDGGYSIA